MSPHYIDGKSFATGEGVHEKIFYVMCECNRISYQTLPKYNHSIQDIALAIVVYAYKNNFFFGFGP